MTPIICPVVGFRTCYPETLHLGTLDILSLRSLKNFRSRKRRVFPSQLSSFLPTDVIKPLCKSCFPYAQGKEAPLSQETERRQEESYPQALLSVTPTLDYTFLILLNLSSFYKNAYSSPNLAEVSSGLSFLGSSFPYAAFCVMYYIK